MTYDEVRKAIVELPPEDQKRLFVEVMPLIWPKACVDEECLRTVRGLVDEQTVAEYKRQHMGSI
ncbi:MAG: hypothetical protein AB7W37_06280 [Syntrophobacteraceae bacterium]|jgi:hypothetical protein